MSCLIKDAIGPSNIYSPTMFGFYEVIMRLLVMYPPEIRCSICYVPITGTNYVVYIDRSPPTLGYVVDTPEYTSPRHIGCIMLPGRDIPDPKYQIVTQPCPGIYTTFSWRLFRIKLISVTSDNITCVEFTKRIIDLLQCVGYISFPMVSAAESNISVSEIMNQLKDLFNQEVVEHATNHMKQIFKLIYQLEHAS